MARTAFPLLNMSQEYALTPGLPCSKLEGRQERSQCSKEGKEARDDTTNCEEQGQDTQSVGWNPQTPPGYQEERSQESRPFVEHFEAGRQVGKTGDGYGCEEHSHREGVAVGKKKTAPGSPVRTIKPGDRTVGGR